jgi:hypothetical protein
VELRSSLYLASEGSAGRKLTYLEKSHYPFSGGADGVHCGTLKPCRVKKGLREDDDPRVEKR